MPITYRHKFKPHYHCPCLLHFLLIRIPAGELQHELVQLLHVDLPAPVSVEDLKCSLK